MVKTVISTIVVAVIFAVGAIIECSFVRTQFDELSTSFEQLYEKVDDKTATENDVLTVQKVWLLKKKKLHVVIPHTEIKEIDLWLSESVTLVRDKRWEDAISKIEVLRELSEQIPKTFCISLDNIF